MNKYANGKIYAIRSPQTDKFYIGSTCETLPKRLYRHKLDFKNKKVKISSYEILKYEDHYIELIEAVKCENKEQLFKIEGEHIRKNLDKVVNIHILGLTRNETVKKYNDNNKEQHKQYREEHQDKIKNYLKLYRSSDEYKAKSKEYHKKYREANKDKLKEYQKQYQKQYKMTVLN
jgi:hypothetical protein